MKLVFFTASEPSITHPKDNQDALFVDKRNKAVGLFDGVSGIAHGGKAADSAAQFCKVELQKIGLEKTLESCHSLLKYKGIREFGKEIATTGIIVQIYTEQVPAMVVWGSAGDSRVYYFSRGKITQQSIDDSLITQAMEIGWLSEARAEKVSQATSLKDLNKVEKNLFSKGYMLTQTLGIGEIKPRIGKFKAKAGDYIILTSDGIHDNLTNKQVEDILKQKPSDPAKKLVEEAIKVSESNSFRARQDDMSAVVIELT